MKIPPQFVLTAVVACAVLGSVRVATAALVPSIAPLSAHVRAAMTGTAWKPGCPVPLDDLRAVRVPYVGFDGVAHTSSTPSAFRSRRSRRGRTTVPTGGFYVGERDYMHFYKLTIGGSGNPLQRPYAAGSLRYIPGGSYEAAEPTGPTR